MTDQVLIIDFGSQVTQLIARRVREAGVYSEIVPFQSAEAAFREMRPSAVILSGGPASVTDATTPRAPQAVFDSGVPVLGICYGEQTMVHPARRQCRGRTITANSAAPMSRWSTTAIVRGRSGPKVRSSGLDEPWRPRHGGLPDGFRGRRHLAQRALCHFGRRRGAQLLCGAVPPRGRAHARWRKAAVPTSCTRSQA
jgi:hypothetical protein